MALVVVVGRYRRFRWAYEDGIAAAAVVEERTRLAEEMHDALGHELSVIALRAGALQVHSTGEVRDQAAQLRADVERAVGVLRESLDLLAGGEDAAGEYEPTTETAEQLLARTSSSGVRIDIVGALPGGLPATVERTAYRIVREGLTNAARHARDAPVTVAFATEGERLRITIGNPVVRPAEPPSTGGAVASNGSGIAALRRRVALLGGELTAGVDGDRHTLAASLPLRPVPGGSFSRNPRRPGPARPMLATLRSTAVPLAVTVALLIAFYVWATTHATLEEDAFVAIAPGASQSTVEAALPDRQSPVRLLQLPGHPAGWTCRHYTDGNFPLGMTTFEICFSGGRVTRTLDARRVAP